MTATGSDCSSAGIDDNADTRLTFLFDDKRLEVSKQFWQELDVVATVEDIFNDNKEPFVVRGFRSRNMRHLMSFMESGILPGEAIDMKELVVLAFYLQYKDEDKLCFEVLSLAALDNNAIEALTMLHSEKKAEIIESVFQKRDFDFELDELYKSNYVISVSLLKEFIFKYIEDRLRSSEQLVGIANEYLDCRLSILEIPKDLKDYEGETLPKCVGHLVVDGDIDEVMNKLEDQQRKKLQEELQNMVFYDLIIETNRIPEFLTNATMNREVDRLYICLTHNPTKSLCLPVTVKKMACVSKLKFCPLELDFSESHYIRFDGCEDVNRLIRGDFKHSYTLIINDCNGMDLRETKIGVNMKHLEMVVAGRHRNKASYKRVLLPEVIQPGLKSLKINIRSFYEKVKVVDISQWDLTGLEELSIYSCSPEQVLVGNSVYTIKSLKVLRASCNSVDLSGAHKNSWKNLKELHVREYHGQIILHSTDQLQRLYVHGSTNGREISLSSSVVDGVAEINIHDCIGDFVFPKSVDKLGRISICLSRGRISLPDYVVGNIAKVDLLKFEGSIKLPKHVCGIIGETSIRSCCEDRQIEIPEAVIKRSKILTLSRTRIVMPHMISTNTSEIEKLCVVTFKSAISFKGWVFPKLREITNEGQCENTLMLVLPTVDKMPSLKRSGVLGTEEEFGAIRLETSDKPLTKAMFVELLPTDEDGASTSFI